jgi:hypothetical protein
MMKKILTMIATLIFWAGSVLPTQAGQENSLTLLFTGDLLGQITPYRG